MKKKIKNLIYLIIGAVSIIATVIFFSINDNGDNSNNSNKIYSNSMLVTGETAFDFKTIFMKNGNVSHTFEFKNEGTESITIEKVYTSCMCTTAFVTDASGTRYGKFGMPGHGGASPLTSIEVKPGESAMLEAVFDPNAHGPSGVGFIERSIYLETNSAKSPKLEFSFQATVTN